MKTEQLKNANDAACREITPEDIIAASDKAYDLGRKHGREEMMDDIERARAVALRLLPNEGKSEIEEAFHRLIGVPNDQQTQRK